MATFTKQKNQGLKMLWLSVWGLAALLFFFLTVTNSSSTVITVSAVAGIVLQVVSWFLLFNKWKDVYNEKG